MPIFLNIDGETRAYESADQAWAACSQENDAIIAEERSTLRRYLRLGRMLAAMHLHVPHGCWFKTLKRVNINARRAERAIEIAAAEADGTLLEAMRRVAARRRLEGDGIRGIKAAHLTPTGNFATDVTDLDNFSLTAVLDELRAGRRAKAPPALGLAVKTDGLEPTSLRTNFPDGQFVQDADGCAGPNEVCEVCGATDGLLVVDGVTLCPACDAPMNEDGEGSANAASPQSSDDEIPFGDEPGPREDASHEATEAPAQGGNLGAPVADRGSGEQHAEPGSPIADPKSEIPKSPALTGCQLTFAGIYANVRSRLERMLAMAESDGALSDDAGRTLEQVEAMLARWIDAHGRSAA